MLEEQHSFSQAEALQEPGDERRYQEETTLQQRVRSDDAPAISTMTLRASPIQDMPIDRITGQGGQSGQGDTATYTGTRRYDEANRHNYAQLPASPPLMSIVTPVSPAASVQPTMKASSTAPIPTPQREERIRQNNRDERYSATQYTVQEISPEPPGEQNSREQERSTSFDNSTIRPAEQVQHVQTNMPGNGETTLSSESPLRVPDNALLLDIV